MTLQSSSSSRVAEVNVFSHSIFPVPSIEEEELALAILLSVGEVSFKTIARWVGNCAEPMWLTIFIQWTWIYTQTHKQSWTEWEDFTQLNVFLAPYGLSTKLSVLHITQSFLLGLDSMLVIHCYCGIRICIVWVFCKGCNAVMSLYPHY